MSEAKRYIPVSPKGGDQRSLSADTRHQAIMNIKEQSNNETWAELIEAGWRIIDSSGPPQQELY